MSEKGGESVEDIDETQVDIAVRFLNNSNVKDTEKDKQVAFLSGKGLSSAEIDLAFKRVAELELLEPDDDSWNLFDYLKGVVLSAGILSAANFAYKAYILPYATRELKDDVRIEGLIESFQAVKDDIKQHTYELTGTLKQIQALMEENQKSLNTINSELRKDAAAAAGPSSSVTELKSEISTIKSMMLSKDKFPAVPFTANKKVNEIPAWQRIAEEFHSEKVKEESSNGNEVTVVAQINQVSSKAIPTEVLTQPKQNTVLEELDNEEISIVTSADLVKETTMVTEGSSEDTPIGSSINEELNTTELSTVTEVVESSISNPDEQYVDNGDIQDVAGEKVSDEVDEQHANELIVVDKLNEQPGNEVIVDEEHITDITVTTEEVNGKEHITDITVTTEVNGILYEVVPDAEQLPVESHSSMISSSENSIEMYKEEDKPEYSLTMTESGNCKIEMLEQNIDNETAAENENENTDNELDLESASLSPEES